MILRPFSVWLRRSAVRSRQQRRDRQAAARHERTCEECSPDAELIRRRGEKLDG